MSIKSSMNKLLWRSLKLRSKWPAEQFWQQRAVVFAPHQDDETLGCGGTILAKRMKKASVSVVFMTDGRMSHAGAMPVADLVALRQREAVAACTALGVDAEDVYFLEFEDGRLTEQVSTAVQKVSELLTNLQPEQVFIPYYKEPPPDHYSTHQAVLSALQTTGRPVDVYEYPVWFWYHWPWVTLWKAPPGNRRAIFKNTVAMLGGLRLLTDFQFIVDVRANLDQKRIALAEHRSQMSRLVPDTHWLTLSDVSDGEWLACFFQEQEVFRHYRFTGNGKHTPERKSQQSGGTPTLFEAAEVHEK